MLIRVRDFYLIIRSIHFSFFKCTAPSLVCCSLTELYDFCQGKVLFHPQLNVSPGRSSPYRKNIPCYAYHNRYHSAKTRFGFTQDVKALVS